MSTTTKIIDIQVQGEKSIETLAKHIKFANEETGKLISVTRALDKAGKAVSVTIVKQTAAYEQTKKTFNRVGAVYKEQIALTEKSIATEKRSEDIRTSFAKADERRRRIAKQAFDIQNKEAKEAERIAKKAAAAQTKANNSVKKSHRNFAKSLVENNKKIQIS